MIWLALLTINIVTRQQSVSRYPLEVVGKLEPILANFKHKAQDWLHPKQESNPWQGNHAYLWAIWVTLNDETMMTFSAVLPVHRLEIFNWAILISEDKTSGQGAFYCLSVEDGEDGRWKVRSLKPPQEVGTPIE